jgi:hypothetical protein
VFSFKPEILIRGICCGSTTRDVSGNYIILAIVQRYSNKTTGLNNWWPLYFAIALRIWKKYNCQFDVRFKAVTLVSIIKRYAIVIKWQTVWYVNIHRQKNVEIGVLIIKAIRCDVSSKSSKKKTFTFLITYTNMTQRGYTHE